MNETPFHVALSRMDLGGVDVAAVAIIKSGQRAESEILAKEAASRVGSLEDLPRREAL